jgi:hypothetical protein
MLHRTLGSCVRLVVQCLSQNSERQDAGKVSDRTQESYCRCVRSCAKNHAGHKKNSQKKWRIDRTLGCVRSPSIGRVWSRKYLSRTLLDYDQMLHWTRQVVWRCIRCNINQCAKWDSCWDWADEVEPEEHVVGWERPDVGASNVVCVRCTRRNSNLCSTARGFVARV